MTPHQYITLSAACQCGGRIMLTPEHWRGRTAQSLIRRGWARLKADPFKTKRSMLFGRITRAGRIAVGNEPKSMAKRVDAIIAAQIRADHDRWTP